MNRRREAAMQLLPAARLFINNGINLLAPLHH
jgi:hypothetical protein